MVAVKLDPASADPATGYRLYRAGQLADLVAEVNGVAASYAPEAITPVIQPLYCELWPQLAGAGVATAGPAIAYYEDVPSSDGAVLVHAAVPVVAAAAGEHGFRVFDLPEVATAASIIHHGSMDDVLSTGQALARWMAANGYRSDGYAREVTVEWSPVASSGLPNCSSRSMYRQDGEMSGPEIVTRAGQPYAAIRARVKMAELGGLGARLGEVFGWLGAHGLAAAGASFFRYNVIDMAAELEVEAGVPVTSAAEGDDQVLIGVLPAGRYATVTHVDHPDQLIEVTRGLLEWAAGQGLKWDMSPSDSGERWACRLESYLTDPKEEPDMSKWATQLMF